MLRLLYIAYKVLTKNLRRGGLYNRYAVNHESFVWKIRTLVLPLPICTSKSLTSHREPGIVRVFEQIWGTDDLIASFDGMNVSLPVNPETGRTDIETTSESRFAEI